MENDINIFLYPLPFGKENDRVPGETITEEHSEAKIFQRAWSRIQILK